MLKSYDDAPLTTDLSRKTLALVLAGGEGSRLKQLTRWRAKPAVPFGGKYRIIDFVLSNCVNSGIRKISVVTQYKSHSLIRHVQRAWSFMRYEVGEFVELMPAQQRIDKGWYKGTADAIYQNLDILRHHTPNYVLILGGDHIYSMDYTRMLAAHQQSGADVTVGCVEVPLEEASDFGVMSIDENMKVTRFSEKPANPECIPGKPESALASMGIYVFSSDFLYRTLIDDNDNPDSSRDFGKDIIPGVISRHNVQAFPFTDEASGKPAYWRDVGTLQAFWKANIDLCSITPELNLYNRDWPVWTYQPQLPPAKFTFDDEGRRGEAIDSLVAGGCIISGGRIKRSIISSDCRIHSYCHVKDTVMLPNVNVHRYCRIQNAVIDKDCEIPEGTIIGEDPEADRQRFYVDESGIVLVTPDMLGQSIHMTR
ncbi:MULTISPECIES: glucose-1-phosphate adenylyltransferase [unclassified Oceanobacter]|jgi:glucose-1-phosphate adenylyltransferase|uniref:glucose-1-phosphate adenylyltransferase n=1 Tax=unclassified Oceanobacter TaxID=2620260 RepID=UPI0026E3E302|nr:MULTISPECIES: glucose-1-phosphate adenylyltransferase [unclassified Oceanobacter]MDO6681710.1 glucose-1-phosphate adenylyltransferase [Oceanobacter sp. 5_MG-2023]MDP2505662.1 glucose-1-phosphate adenylyltransferase [Oceanobacter sp. 3_MG-2023]MDP2547511.1 glucose-1-phosphate adenylyltransferase [Oceanobacter sp. 4_MG-2023]MDP2608299.1 glucose-1-phosphate adenylyltransferase [Oceanobacter sp. 1_MG-2023]MDP2612184.1 glucose-1-phosphate adenylyltransferase [Oceanobacter sp. 2_MG-2023]